MYANELKISVCFAVKLTQQPIYPTEQYVEAVRNLLHT